MARLCCTNSRLWYASLQGWGQSAMEQGLTAHVDVGFSQGHHSKCRVHTRSCEFGGRCGVKGRTDRKLHPKLSSKSTRSGDYCSTTLLFQLETRSIGWGNGCFWRAMEDTHGLCKPSVVFDRQSPVLGVATTSSNSVWKGHPMLLGMSYDCR